MDQNKPQFKDKISKRLSLQFDPMELENTLIQISDEEMLQTERPANNELIKSCHDLLYHLHGEEFPADHLLQNSLQRIKQHIEKTAQIHKILHSGLRAAVILIFLSFFALFHDHFAAQNLLYGNSIENEEKYRIEGHQPSNTLINQSIALDRTESIQLTTKEINEITEILGYTPKHPSWIPSGWKLSYYVLITSQSKILFTATYEHPDYDMVLMYSSSLYVDPDNAAANFEQDSEGHSEFWGLQNVYISTNMENHFVVWLNGNEMCHINGPVSMESIRKMYDSLNI